MGSKRNIYGEGNYQASRVYNKATRQFVESGRVEEAARNAEPKDAAEAEELKQAEQAGLQRAKGTDSADVMDDSNDARSTAGGERSQDDTGMEETGQSRLRNRSRH